MEGENLVAEKHHLTGGLLDFPCGKARWVDEQTRELQLRVVVGVGVSASGNPARFIRYRW